MKNIFFHLILIPVLLLQEIAAVPVLALSTEGYDCYIEAESYSASNWKCDGGSIRVSDTAASGGVYATLYTDTVPSGNYYIDYILTAPEAGVYDLDIASTPLIESNWASEIYIRVNADKDVKLIGEKFKNITDRLAWYHADAVNLKAGANSIRFLIKKPISNGKYVAFIDAFGLKKSESEVRYITADAPFKVFEQAEKTILSIRMNNLVQADTDVSWSVTDVFGNAVGSGTVTVKKGKNSEQITMENLPKGYYQMTAGGVTSGFSVVKPLSERKTYPDTPFAIDTNFSGSVYYPQEYAKVLGLSGVSWIRDRLWAKNITTKTEDRYSFVNSSIPATDSYVAPYGIRVSNAVEYLPEDLMGDYSNYIPEDLHAAYSFWKQLTEHFGTAVDNWEIFNETDLGGATSSSDSPDLYAATMKAAAIGIADGKGEAAITAMTQGAAERVNSDEEYIKMLMRNDMFDFSAADNTHAHLVVKEGAELYYPFAGSEDIKNHVTAQERLNAEAPIWVTEAGIAIAGETPGNFTLSEQMVQAKYIVTSTVESIASGTDKHFFFIGPNYNEGTNEWGMMSAELVHPYMYASLAAQSAMTDILGEGIYYGKLSGMEKTVHGHGFLTDGTIAFVLWNEGGEKTVTLSETPDAVYDLFGNSLPVSSTLMLCDVPVYAVFSQSAPEVVNQRREMKTISEPKFTDAQRVILMQKYSDTARGGSRADGYFINENDNTVTVVASNLGNRTMVGKIVGQFENGWSLEDAEQEISVAPGGTASVTFSINPRYDIQKDYLSFYGVFDGEQTSKTAAKLNARRDSITIMEAERHAESYDSVFEKGAVGLTAAGMSESAQVIFAPYLQNAGLYDVWVLGGYDYQVIVNGKAMAEVSRSDVGWYQISEIRFSEGKNHVTFLASGADAFLDKIAISKSGTRGLWMEAENYSQKRGYYKTEKKTDASGNTAMRLFTYGIVEPCTDNQLKYDFFIEEQASYDVWILSSRANVDWLTKWKWGLDSECSYPSVKKLIKADYMYDNIDMYWHLVKSNERLDVGMHSLVLVGDEERASSDGKYMLHIADAVVLAESGTWSPTGVIAVDRESYLAPYYQNPKINVSFYDVDGERTHTLEQTTKVSVDIDNASNAPVNAEIYCALYHAMSGKLLSVKKTDMSVADNSIESMEMDISISDTNLTPYQLSVFAWDAEMVPHIKKNTLQTKWNQMNVPVTFQSRLYLSGETKEAGERVSVTILSASDKPYEEMSVSQLLEHLIYVTETTTDDNGRYCVEIADEWIPMGANIRISSQGMGLHTQEK